MNKKALNKIGYGLYLLTANDGVKDNGCIINTLLQVTSSASPTNIITVSKQNYTHDMILASKQFNISTLTNDTPFSLFQHFGFQSGKNCDKFSDCHGTSRSKNGLSYLNKHTNAYLSHEVVSTIDFSSHTLFIAKLTDAVVLSDAETVSYSHYHKHIKPSSDTKQNGYRCTICNYVYENDKLPANFICPLCKHGIDDFVRIT